MRFIRGRLSSALALNLVYGQSNGESSIEEGEEKYWFIVVKVIFFLVFIHPSILSY